MRRSSVDLPQPLGPTSETSSPGATESETSIERVRAAGGSSGVGKVLAHFHDAAATSLRVDGRGAATI